MVISFLLFALALTSTRAVPNIMEQMVEQNVTIFPDLVEMAQLSEMLASSGPLTLILPTDEAFRAMPSGFIEDLQADPIALKDYVLYHLMKGDIFSWDIPGRTVIKSLNGHVLRLYYYADEILGKPILHINNAKVLRHDLQASNGVIQIVDKVLRVPHGTIEEVLNNHPNLTQISKATIISHLYNYLNTTKVGSRMTFFAPSDEAFEKMDQHVLKQVLKNPHLARTLVGYHLHSGTLTFEKMQRSLNGFISTQLFFDDIILSHGKDGEPRLNRFAKIITHDIECDNGLVHIIDRVLIPSSPFHNIG